MSLWEKIFGKTPPKDILDKIEYKKALVFSRKPDIKLILNYECFLEGLYDKGYRVKKHLKKIRKYKKRKFSRLNQKF